MQNESTVYEIGFHMNPSLPEGELASKVSNLTQAISERGGTFISEGFPTLSPLAYTIVKRIGNENKRFTQSFFGWVKFEMNSASVVDLKKVLEVDTDVIRFIIIKTVREDTMISNKPEFKLALADGESGEEAPEAGSGEPKVNRELTEEEEALIDKGIDELVSDEETTKEN